MKLLLDIPKNLKITFGKSDSHMVEEKIPYHWTE